MKKFGILIYLLALGVNYSQEFKTSITRDSIFIGEQLELYVTVYSSTPFGIEELRNSIQSSIPKEIEIVGFKSRVKNKDNEFIYELKWKLTCFEPGSYIIFLNSIKLSSKEYTLNPQNLDVFDFPVDSIAKPLYDIKTIEKVELTFWEKWGETILFSLLTLGLLSLFIFLVIYKYRKKEKKDNNTAALEPYLVAKRKISESVSWYQKDASFIRKSFVQATDALREYLHDGFKYPALVLLSDDLVEYIRKHPRFTEKEINILANFLSLSDRIKFAKYRPDTKLVDKAFNEIFVFLDSTRPQQLILNPQEQIRSLFDEPLVKSKHD